MEGVEDIPGAALHEGLAWDWESFPEYLDALERRPRDIDIGAQLPHGALRVYRHGRARRRPAKPATDADIAEMRALAAEAMRAGALGFSTSRTLNHRTVQRRPDAVVARDRGRADGHRAWDWRDAGRGVIEMISDFDTPDLESEFAMMRRLVQASGRPLSLSLAQRHADPEGWRGLLGQIERPCAEGLPMGAQVAPRPIGLLLGLQASLNPFTPYPAYHEIQHNPWPSARDHARSRVPRAPAGGSPAPDRCVARQSADRTSP